MTDQITSGNTSETTFSVLIAAYNQADYVLTTLDSVADQTFGDFEIVLVNDGSTDDTEARVARWIDAFRQDHPNRAVLSSIPNSGQSAALEHGFALCRGRYIALLDSDDRWLPDKLEAVFRASSEDPRAGMIVHPLYVVDAKGGRTGDVRPKRAKLSEGDLREQIMRTGRHVAPATSGVVIAAEVFRRLLPMPTKGFRSAADSYLTFGASMEAPVRAIHVPLGEYRMHPGGQYLQRMLSPEGLLRSVELQLTIARHFGVEDAARNNSFFARNVFAVAKLRAGLPEQLRAYGGLARATLADRSFGPRERALLVGYWTACLFAPRPLFSRLWRAFQLKQTGYDRVEGPAPNA